MDPFPEKNAPVPRWLFRLCVVAFWMLFMLLVIGISSISFYVKGKQMDIGNTLVWQSGWILWAGTTFIVLYLARRFPVDRNALAFNIFRQVGLGFAVALGHVAFEYTFANLIDFVFFNKNPTWKDFVWIFVYKFHIYLIIYWAIVGAVTAYNYYTKYQKSELASTQLEAKLAQSQLGALKMQLHPHFLFNTHNSIMSLMMKKDNERAIRMLTRLSDLLRLTLEKTSEQVVPLKDELDALDLYLSIQKERFQERLEVKIDVDPELYDAEVPYLLLQPIVENSLQHGISPKTEGGYISISASIFDGQLQLNVKDDGIGIKNDLHSSSGNGIGLKNTRIRLKGLYGNDHDMIVKSTEGLGTEVAIQLPYNLYRKAK